MYKKKKYYRSIAQLPMYKLLEKLNILDYHPFSIYKITKKEIQEVIFAASLFEIAGIDNIPIVV